MQRCSGTTHVETKMRLTTGRKLCGTDSQVQKWTDCLFSIACCHVNFLHLLHQDHWAVVVLSPFKEIVDRRSYDNGYEDD
jgi:hypothetical protein